MVLFVDDEVGVLQSLQRLFRREPYLVHFVSSGKEALALLPTLQDLALIISDQRMPDMVGTEFLIRSRELAPDAIRMLLTGYSDFGATIHAMNDGGATRYISKPWNDRELVQLVRNAVQEYCRKKTESKEVEKEMLQLLHQSEAANRLKTQLLANLSHELRTPLNGVLGCAQLLGMGDLTPEQQEFVGLIDSSVSRELLLIENLLEQSRMESGEFVITRSPFLLGQCVYEAVAVYQRAVREKGVSLTVTISPELNSEVLADKGRIHQILAALLDNALKFTAHGEIAVSCSALQQREGSLLVSFTVSDTGTGIEKDALAHIFEPFTQADMSNTRKYGGMGLGLSICRSLATAMGGRIWAESRPGSGSSFHLDLTVHPVADGN